MSDERLSQPAKLNRAGINRIIQVISLAVIFSAILFGFAGRLDWWEAWGFLAIYLLGIIANATWTLRHNPEVINERGRIGENTKWWDKIIVTLYTVFLLGTFVIAGLDARFRWSSVPVALKYVGGIGLILAMGMVFWVMTANTFLSGTVRIQAERNQQVVTIGPYRFVRHPMYVGLLLLFLASPLLLGSWWALIPSVLNVIVFIIRTALEDRTLQAELAGYVEYTQHVHYRLIPGVW